jgi:pimeloyl-ACP methyl ester carboxylesterase
MSRRLLIKGVFLLSMLGTAARTAELGFVPSSDGVPLCVYETGRREAPALLFVHGMSQSCAVFKRQFESDLARDYHLVALDLRGHGCSGKPWAGAS